MDAVISIFKGLGVNESIQYMFGIFVVTFFILRFLFIDKLAAHVIERDHRIEGRKHESEKALAESEKYHDELNAGLRKAQKQAADIFNSLRVSAADEQRKIIGGAREAASKEILEAREDASQKLAQEVSRIETEIPVLAKLIVEKLGGSKSASRGELTSSAGGK